MITVSAVARLIPRPPARVERRKQNCWAPGAEEEGWVRGKPREVGVGRGGWQTGRQEGRQVESRGENCNLITDKGQTCTQ